jgi:hypothetical protein
VCDQLTRIFARSQSHSLRAYRVSRQYPKPGFGLQRNQRHVIYGVLTLLDPGLTLTRTQANQEQFFPFYVIGLLALLALSVLAFSTLGIQENVTGDLAFIQDEGNLLADVIAPWFATFSSSLRPRSSSSRPTSAFWTG